MGNYVNSEAFLAWYRSIAKGKTNENEVLGEVLLQYNKTGRSVFVVPADRTVTGKKEEYPFTIENIGCCGASTVYIYF